MAIKTLSIALSLMFLGSALAEDVPIHEIRLLTFAPNPDGLQIGFWANYKNSGEILRDFGLRPFERVSFHTWRQIEKAPGDRRWDTIFGSEKRAHLAGSSVITNVNTFFTRRLNPQGMDAIPAFYEQDIQNPETRRAARELLAEFTTRVLNDVGAVKLLLDYELFWFAMPRTPEIRQAYRDWFLEAAEVCRETARSLGKADMLQIGCCVNTNPFDTGKSLLGRPADPPHEPQQWLLDVVAACDFFAIDSYAQTKDDPTSPQAFLNVVKFWIEHYAGDKPVFITENGFSTAVEHGFTEKGYHARGTEADQAEFFRQVFSAFEQRNTADFAFLQKVRGYGIWMYRDMPHPESLLEEYFGITRRDGSHKPAWEVIRNGIRMVEDNPAMAPTRLASTAPVDLRRMAAEGLEVSYESGTKHQAIEVALNIPAGSSTIELSAESDDPACLLAQAPGGEWVSTFPKEDKHYILRIPVHKEGGRQKLTLYLTSAKLPFSTRLRSLQFQPSPAP